MSKRQIARYRRQSIGIPVVSDGRNYRVVFDDAGVLSAVAGYRPSTLGRIHVYTMWQASSGKQPSSQLVRVMSYAQGHHASTPQQAATTAAPSP